MLILTKDSTLLEVPGEVSISFSVYGCPLACPGCSWKDNHDYAPYELTPREYYLELEKYAGLATCVLWLGGDWCPDLPDYLKEAAARGYKTCLYTGCDEVSDEITQHLTYLKTGPYIADLGGLDSPTTNQIFKNLLTGEVLTHLFQRGKDNSMRTFKVEGHGTNLVVDVTTGDVVSRSKPPFGHQEDITRLDVAEWCQYFGSGIQAGSVKDIREFGYFTHVGGYQPPSDDYRTAIRG